jgi:ATP-dependent DNA helicase DinG
VIEAGSIRSTRSQSARELLGPHGPLARALVGYEAREGQLQMAEAVERTLVEERVLLCEAGTGTGKTLAYLVPAVLSGKKVIVSTATRALEEQIALRDIPFLERALGLKVRASVMKGLANYVCLRRHHEFLASAEALRPGFARAIEALKGFVGESLTGDTGELAGFAESDPIWREVSSSSDTRVGIACPWFEECFVTRMKREAEQAQIVIVNHHLFFADLALRGPHPGHVLPDYDAVIFDEAHQLEDIATDFFGLRISRARIEQLQRDAERALQLAGLGDPLLAPGGGGRLVQELERTSLGFWTELMRSTPGNEPRVALERDVWHGTLEQSFFQLDTALEALISLAASAPGRVERTLRARPGTAEAFEVLGRRAEQIREQLAGIVDGGPGRVTWLERAGRGLGLRSSPVDISELFRERVFDSVPAVVLTSATLASRARVQTRDSERPQDSGERPARASNDGPFAFLRSRLGLGSNGSIQVSELVVPSPFDFERRALLYLPRDLPAPQDARFVDRASRRIAELVAITGGGAFVLTTSLRSMRALHTQLVALLPERRVLLQGEAPKRALISAFRACGDAVLVATSSFWEGVDIPGRALRLVVLEKIPFAVPTDPIVLARTNAIVENGGNAFLEYHVPAAAITLKQGFGRLIRTQSDAGIVALFDERVHRRGYGARLLASLPPARRAHLLDEVREFWQGLE